MLYILLLIITFVFASTNNLYAVPAAPHFHELQQPDGTKIIARQWGDEHSHGWEAESEHSIVFDEQLKGWTYAVHDSRGKLKSSSTLVGPSTTPPNGIMKRLRPVLSSQETFTQNKISSADSSAIFQSANTTGTKNVPVILINYNDTSFTYSSADFEALLFGTNNNSMRKYYLENSYNQLTLTSGPSGVIGPFNASNTHDYYGTDVGDKGNDQNPRALVLEAVQNAVAAGFKFAPYVDQTISCFVDSVTIVHQGRGQEAGGNVTDIWSHSWELTSPYDTREPCALGGTIKVQHYVIQPERLGTGMTTFGVFAHEYGHALGLPDLYDTTYLSRGDGSWTIMAAGSWLGSGGSGYGGDSPAHFDAWSKYYLGWITPINITGINSNRSITATSSVAPSIYKLGSGTPSSGEYFLVENRYKSGFDAFLPGSGLLVWHIDGNSISSYLSSNSVNDHACRSTTTGACSDSSTHYGVALIQSDNLLNLEKNTAYNYGDGNDPYYSPKTLTDLTAPNTKFWSGTASSYGITDISLSSETMTATLIGPPAAPFAATNFASGVAATSATLNGTVNDNNDSTSVSFDYGLTAGYGSSASGGNIIAGSGNMPVSAVVSGLTCNSTYHFRVSGINEFGTSNGTDKTFTTTACYPGAPSITSVAAGNSRAIVYFSPPVSNGGSQILNFTVTPSIGLPVSGDTVPFMITGLANGTSYTFTAKATNAAGTGPASTASSVVISGIAIIDDAYETGYQLLQHAYNADTSREKIMLLADAPVGGLTVDSSNSKGNVTIKGGYNDAFTDHDGLPSILGKVTLSAGTTRFQNVIVRSP